MIKIGILVTLMVFLGVVACDNVVEGGKII